MWCRTRGTLPWVLICLAGSSMACFTWQELAPQPGAALLLDSTQTYRVVLKTGDSLEVRQPHIVGDSVAWTEQVNAGTYWEPKERRLAVANIARIEVQHESAGGTIGAILGLGVAAVLLLMASTHISVP